uniref:Chromosome 18 open reading frame 21 n=1 Tax=Ursus maritimus TaxID=29073 RepID=A0A452T3C9_URSMA
KRFTSNGCHLQVQIFGVFDLRQATLECFWLVHTKFSSIQGILIIFCYSCYQSYFCLPTAPLEYDNITFEGTCPYCFQLLVLDNSRVRLKPKSRLTPKIQKLLNREARNYTLSFKEAKILKKYKDSKSVLLTTCKTCNRTVKHHGKSRSFLSALKSSPTTPTSKLSLKTPERKTPSSANLSHTCGSKGKSPALIFRTPISGQSTPTCSSKNILSSTGQSCILMFQFSQLLVCIKQC